jgi:hypothetical protein
MKFQITNIKMKFQIAKIKIKIKNQEQYPNQNLV